MFSIIALGLWLIIFLYLAIQDIKYRSISLNSLLIFITVSIILFISNFIIPIKQVQILFCCTNGSYTPLFMNILLLLIFTVLNFILLKFIFKAKKSNFKLFNSIGTADIIVILILAILFNFKIFLSILSTASIIGIIFFLIKPNTKHIPFLTMLFLGIIIFIVYYNIFGVSTLF